MNNTIRTTLLAALALTMAGCAAVRSESNDVKAVAVEPAPDAGFIEHPERQGARTTCRFKRSEPSGERGDRGGFEAL